MNLSKNRWILWCGLLALAHWSYWSTLGGIAEMWSTKPEYSHGYLVPVFAAFLLWHRRGLIPEHPLEPSWWGLPLIILGASLHLFGAYFYFEWISAASILPVLAGITVASGGRKLLHWTWPAIAFLAFMLPLPFTVEVALAYRLQRIATLVSTYLLQTLGFAAVAEGNVIIMEEARLGVVEACNGLGMLVTFFALATAVAMLLTNRITDKVIFFLSAIPIALLANVMRITLTGVLEETVGHRIADIVFHDLAGWIMMPLALGMLWIEKLVLSKLFVERAEVDLPFKFAGPKPAPQESPVLSAR